MFLVRQMLASPQQFNAESGGNSIVTEEVLMAQKGEGTADRRTFLKMASVGTLATGAAAVTGGAAQANEEMEVQGSGYRESDHVKKVYELSRF